MTSSSARFPRLRALAHWAWLVARPVGLLFVLCSAGAALCLALIPLARDDTAGRPVVGSPIAHRPEHAEYWQARLVKAAAQTRRSVRAVMTPREDPGSLILLLELEAPKSSELSEALYQDLETPRRRAMFVRAAFGAIVLNDALVEPEELGIPLIETCTEHDKTRVQFRVTRFASPSASSWGSLALPPLALQSDTLDLELHHAALVRLTPEPRSASADGASLAALPGTALPPVIFSLRPLPEKHGSARRDSRRGVLQRISTLAEIPFIGALLSAVASALPLLAFLVLLRRKRIAASELELPTVTLVAFHLAYSFGVGVTELARYPILEDLSAYVEWRFTTYYSPMSLRPPLVSACLWPTVVALLSGLMASVFLQASRPAEPEVSPAGPRRVFVSVLIGLALVCVTVSPYMAIRWEATYWQVMTAWSTLALAVSLLAAKWLCHAIGIKRFGYHAALCYVASLLVACVWFVMTADRGPWIPAVDWYPFTIAAGVPMIVAFVFLGCRFFSPAFPGLRERLALNWRPLLVVALLAAIPVERFVHPGAAGARVSEIKNLAHAMEQFVLLFWAGGILVLLRQSGRTSMSVSEADRRLGLLMFAALFFSPDLQWSYIPMTFLLGWAVFEWNLVGPARTWEALGRLAPRVAEERQKLLDHLLDLNAAERTYAGLRERLRDRLVKGEIKFNEYDNILDDSHRELNDLRRRLKIEQRSPAEIALEFGPHANAWDNAVHGGKMALLLSAPWIVLGLRDLLMETNPDDSYPLWSLVFKLLILPVKWGAFGVFLGYFYPFIKGRSGLGKGFYLFLAVVAASVPLAAVSAASDADWRALVIWAMEVLVHCLLIGLIAFDLETLKHSGYRDWRMLLAVHDLPALGASFSSIVVAIAAIVTAAVTSGASTLVNQALKFFLPAGAELPPGPT